MIGEVRSPYIQKPQASGGGNVAQLEQQKKALQKEIKRVKEDNKLEPEAKEKKLDVLQKKLQKIEDAIQKASADSKKNSGTKISAVKETKEVSDPDDLKNFLHNQDSKTKEMQEQMRKRRFDEIGNLLNLYV